MVVACPDWDVAQRYIDKRQTYRVAEAAGVPTPKTVVPRTAEDAERALDVVGLPALVKPSQSHLFVAAFRSDRVPGVSSTDG